MGRVEAEMVRQGKYLRMHRIVEGFRAALLEVSPPTAPDEKGVSSESKRVVVGHVSYAT